MMYVYQKCHNRAITLYVNLKNGKGYTHSPARTIKEACEFVIRKRFAPVPCIR